MTVESSLHTLSKAIATVDWTPSMPPTDLIFDDGEPLESNRHRIAMNALIRSMLVAFADRTDYFAGGNMFVYYSSEQVKNRDFRGPDFFAVLNVDGNRERQGWVVWEENGRYPDVIIELMSPSTAAIDIGIKREIYEKIFRTPDYFVFDPFNPNSLRGWHLDVDAGYQELTPNPQGWLWCQRLELWVGTWQGTLDRETAAWLRFYDPEGHLVLLPDEAERQRADAEQQRADAERQRADAEQQRADAERQRADAAEQQGALRQLLRLLTLRFGKIPDNLESQLQTSNISQLENLVEVALTVGSLEEFLDHP